MTMTQPTADRNQDPNRLPERCCILLLPEQLAPTILESVPSNLRGGFRFYGSVTPQEYLRLSGAADCRDLKYHLAVQTEDHEGFAIFVTPEDVLTHKTSYKAMQTRVINYFLKGQGQETPEDDAEKDAMAKSAAEMPYAAIEFLLSLCDVYDYDIANITDDCIAEALDYETPPLTAADFAHTHPEN